MKGSFSMGANVITVTRQFGSLGRPIAKQLAERLGFEYYDRDIIELSASSLGEPAYALSEYDDSRMKKYRKMMLPLGFGVGNKQDRIFEAQKEVILSLANKKDCVIVGRCSDFIMWEAKHRSLYNVFIYAPRDARFNYCLNHLGFTKDSAETYIQKIDVSRSAYYSRYTGRDFDSVAYRHLMVDSSVMPIEKTVELLCRCAELRFNL
jgi:cytidylate kinase